MYRIFYLLLLFIGLSSCSNNNDTKLSEQNLCSTLEGNWNYFISNDDEFSLCYPNDWIVKNIENINFAAIRDDKIKKDYHDNFLILIVYDTLENNLEEIRKNYLNEQISENTDYNYEIIGDGHLNIKNEVSNYWIDYYVNIDDHLKIYTLSTFIKKNSKLVMFTFTSNIDKVEENKLVFFNVLKSFSIK